MPYLQTLLWLKKRFQLNRKTLFLFPLWLHVIIGHEIGKLMVTKYCSMDQDPKDQVKLKQSSRPTGQPVLLSLLSSYYLETHRETRRVVSGPSKKGVFIQTRAISSGLPVVDTSHPEY